VPILHPHPNAKTFANAVSADGTVIVGSAKLTDSREAFRWSAEDGMVALEELPGGTPFSAAYDISPDGSVIVGFSNSALGTEACRWTDEEGVVGLGDLDGGDFRSTATAVSADGFVIVGRGTTETGAPLAPGVAFIWDAESGMRDLRQMLIEDFGLDLDGWSLRMAAGISDDGSVIVGWGKNPAGHTEGWIVRIIRDEDGDGIPDSVDDCPIEDASGLDANGDGCIDRVADLARTVAAMDTLAPTIRRPLVAIAERAASATQAKATRGKLKAFILLVEAQREKRISHDDADLLVDFVENSLTQLP
jgi:probable HAF family extracellular repeat protein